MRKRSSNQRGDQNHKPYFEALEPRLYLAADVGEVWESDNVRHQVVDSQKEIPQSAGFGDNSGNGYKSFFWMVGRENMIFSDQILRHIAERGYSQVVLGLGNSGDVGGLYDDFESFHYPQYEPNVVAARLHELNPDIQVLLYLRQGTDYLGQYLGNRVYETLNLTESDYLRNFHEPGELTIEEIMATPQPELYDYALWNGTTYSFKNGLHFDWSSDQVLDEYSAAIQSAFANHEQFQIDGFMFDNNFIDPTVSNQEVADSFQG